VVPGLRYGRHRACSGDPSVITLGLAVVLVSGPWIPFWSCSVSRARCSPCAARLTLSCSYVKAGLALSVLKTVRARIRLRQRIASRLLLPSACLRSRYARAAGW
jgi:hypothetical protein